MSLNHIVSGGAQPPQNVTVGNITSGDITSGDIISGDITSGDIKLKDGQFGSTALIWNEGSLTNEFQVYVNSTQFRIANDIAVGVLLTSGATSWSALSDQRLKKNITECKECLDKVSQLKAYHFDYVSDPTDSASRIGLLAQEVDAQFPECVTRGKINPNDDTEYLSVKYSELIPALVQSIKELKVRVEALEAHHP